MALPSIIQRLYSFTGFQQAQGNDAFPGTQIDADLDQTNNTVSALVSLVQTLVRPDGKLANGSVTRNSLAADIVLGLGASRPWSSGNAYAPNDTVTRGYGLYVALAASGGADPTASPAVWALLADLSTAVVIAPGSIGTASFADGAITEPKLAAGAGSTRFLADASVTALKAARNLGVLPVGAEVDYAGYEPPPGWLLCGGQALSRTTYADLLNALCPPFAADVAAGSNLLGSVTPISGIGMRGAFIEGPGIPSGTTLVNDGVATATMSNAATANGAHVTLRLFPHGRGDGATTFNIPDRRGVVVAGRDDMGGNSAGRLVTVFDGANLSGRGGTDTIAISIPQLPTFTPSGSISGAPDIQLILPYQRLSTGYTAGGGVGAINTIGDDAAPNQTSPTRLGGAHGHSFTGNSIGNGQSHGNVQPTGVANRIIFTGV